MIEPIQSLDKLQPARSLMPVQPVKGVSGTMPLTNINAPAGQATHGMITFSHNAMMHLKT